MAEMIKKTIEEKAIIYCARKQDCEDIQDELQFKLPTYSLDIFYGGLKNSHIISDSCNKCDNCIRYEEENPELLDATEEVYEMLEVAEVLTSEFSAEISPEDIVDIFSRSNTEKIRRNKYNQLVLHKRIKLYEEKNQLY
ncbi:23972_t:CDS:2 [Dentiscutata erythropus]|uniref:23972_t:CDS:1 n=1 Tax=Dentiscutata erythropus TaxID=1348616 RepID=A0A9N9BGB0_9GLOM|nr:23972_t:CDS:2 [Dentiscutata erythropus]